MNLKSNEDVIIRTMNELRDKAERLFEKTELPAIVFIIEDIRYLEQLIKKQYEN